VSRLALARHPAEQLATLAPFNSEELTSPWNHQPIYSAASRDRITSVNCCSMARRCCWIFVAILAGALAADNADARGSLPGSNSPPSIVNASPTLAPFQHVRFCIRYPADCRSDPAQTGLIVPTPGVLRLLQQVNHSVNVSILPTLKDYGSDLANAWQIAPDSGDCNDYAVTKRHELIEKGLPSRALRLSVVTTATGTGHLVLVVTTANGDLVMDNLTDAIRAWRSTDYHWLKIQSADDAQLWYEVRPSVRD